MQRLKSKIIRQERILSSLADLTYATGKQIQHIEGLSSNRTARRILFELEKDKLIRSIRRECKVYYLTNKGSDSIGRGNSRLKKSEITHCLMRNDLYIDLGMPKDWKKEAPIIVNGDVFLISDARYSAGGKYYFVEIDNKQSMRNNYDKIKKYAGFFDIFAEEYGYYPTLIWKTLSETRKEKIAETCEKLGINYEI